MKRLEIPGPSGCEHGNPATTVIVNDKGRNADSDIQTMAIEQLDEARNLLHEQIRQTPEVPWRYRLKFVHSDCACVTWSQAQSPQVGQENPRPVAGTSVVLNAWNKVGASEGWVILPYGHDPHRPTTHPIYAIGRDDPFTWVEITEVDIVWDGQTVGTRWTTTLHTAVGVAIDLLCSPVSENPLTDKTLSHFAFFADTHALYLAAQGAAR